MEQETAVFWHRPSWAPITMNNNLSNGQTASTAGLIRATKTNPCPHCGKPDWCYSVGDLSVCNRDQPPAPGWEATTKADKDGHYFYARPQEKKAIRSRQTRNWLYLDRAGNPLVRVVRFDDGEGGKPKWHQESWGKCKASKQIGWVVGVEGITRENIPIYRYADVKKAIAKNELIFIVEGEGCADILWDLGLAATCNIGGSGKWRSSDTSDLEGAKVVICPDRDEPGIKHANLLHQEFPNALWLYAYPNSPFWNNLPKSQGLDIVDWIQQENVAVKGILAAVGEKKETQQISKVASHPKFQIPDVSELGQEIEQLLDSDLKKSQLQLKISELAQRFRINSTEIWKVYRQREEELEQEASQEDTAIEVARLLSAQRSQLELSEILPLALAAPIGKLAAILNLKTECYLAALLTQVSSLFKVGSEVLLRRDTDYRCTPNYFAGIVAESSQKKSPIMRAMIDRPMQSLREKAREEYRKACDDYEQESATYKSNKKKSADGEQGSQPKPPRQRLYSFSKATGEGILYQVAEHPDQALMYRCDELAGLFKSANQYRGGKGSDDEDLLEFWNGTGSTVLRASGTKADLDGLLLSVFGTIQPDVLASLLKDCSDSNGKFARFDFVFQPLAASKLPEEDSGSFDITPMLSSLYTKIDALPALKLELNPEAKRLFTGFSNATEERRVTEPKQGIRAMVGKMPEKVGKMAAIIHTLTCVFNGAEVGLQIPKSAVEAAIKFVKFSADQIASLYAEFSDRKALAPNLVKILLLAERKAGVISTREAQHAFPLKQRPSAQQIREWFGELQIMKYGKLTTVKKTVSFILTTTTVTTVTSNKDGERFKDDHSKHSPLTTMTTVNESTVVNCGLTVVKGEPQLESLPSKALESTVVTVVKNLPPLQNSQSLLQSCNTINTTKPELEVGDKVVVVYSDNPMYRGQRGRITEVWWLRDSKQAFTILFDKLVHGMQQVQFPAADVMRIQ